MANIQKLMYDNITWCVYLSNDNIIWCILYTDLCPLSFGNVY
jgi:hypothetical protein